MKRQDIKVGDRLAYRPSKYDRPREAVVLDSRPFVPRTGDKAVTEEGTEVVGWRLAEKPEYHKGKTLVKVQRDRNQLSYVIMASNGYLIGPWETVSAQYEAEIAAEAKRREERDAAFLDRQARVDSINARVNAMGLDGPNMRLSWGAVAVDLDLLERLVDLAER